MEKNEKVDFILEQMRLCLAKKDYIRAQIISNKISIKFFENNNEPVRMIIYIITWSDFIVREQLSIKGQTYGMAF